MLKRFLLAMIVIMTIVLAGCGRTAVNKPKDFGFVFSYGVGAKNVLDTFEEKYTKDMISADSITIDYRLAPKQMDDIYNKMNEIGLMDYPENYNPKSNSEVTPYMSYYFKVKTGDTTKEVKWDDVHLAVDRKSKNLRELAEYIMGIIHNSKEYKSLPTPVGGYD